ncbi:MAG: hypothetical protein H0W48_00200 [Methylibium sp.]|nr:hypothetical protein [Methylibium sp.]
MSDIRIARRTLEARRSGVLEVIRRALDSLRRAGAHQRKHFHAAGENDGNAFHPTHL